jgi:hypothetical protein
MHMPSENLFRASARLARPRACNVLALVCRFAHDRMPFKLAGNTLLRLIFSKQLSSPSLYSRLPNN